MPYSLFEVFEVQIIPLPYLHMQRDNIYGDGDSLVGDAARGTASTVVVFQDVLQGSIYSKKSFEELHNAMVFIPFTKR